MQDEEPRRRQPQLQLAPFAQRHPDPIPASLTSARDDNRRLPPSRQSPVHDPDQPSAPVVSVTRSTKGVVDRERRCVFLFIIFFSVSLFVPATRSLLLAACRVDIRRLTRLDVGSMDTSCSFSGAFHWIRERVSKTSLVHPFFSTCCQRGSVHLPLLPDPPPFLRGLLDQRDRQSIDYLNNIRRYNMVLAFTSLGVTEDRLVNPSGGWVFRISGEPCHHFVGSLRLDEGEVPAFAQLYIFDPQVALCQRMHRNNNLREDTMSDLQAILLSHHCYAHDFRHAFEVPHDYSDVPNAAVRLRVTPGQTSGQYALPSSDEVAVILPGDDTAILLRCRSLDNEPNLTQIL